jgi:hypothetical protein
MSNPGKADYHWLDELITIRDNVHEHGMQVKDVADAMGKKPITIKAFLRNLSLIEDYLQTIGKEGQLDYIDNLKQAFKDITQHHMKLDSMKDKQAIYKEMAFNLLSSPDASKNESLHRKLEKLEKNFLDSLRTYSELRESTGSENVSDRLGSDVLERLSGASLGEFTSVSISPRNAEAVETAIGMAGEKQSAEDEANAPFRNAVEANRLLQAIEISNKTTSRPQLSGQLNAILTKTTSLLKELKGMN